LRYWLSPWAFISAGGRSMKRRWLKATSAKLQGLLAALPLLFVPAGVGVVQYMGLLREQGLALAVALVVSTVATLLATVGVFLLVKRLTGAKGEA
jgi:putative effector of murein hydrolase LrgA (UPF0299 family)